MNIVLLVASTKGEMCGVADYTERLAAAMSEIGASVRLEMIDRWSFSSIRALRRRYSEPCTVFHMQYPSLKLGRSIAPGLLPFLLPNSFVTLHEFGLFNMLRKLIFAFPGLLSRRVIFSNETEKRLFQRYFPFSQGRLTVLPIGNNIPRNSALLTERSKDRLAYFGQISRNKGIEFFIDTVSRLRALGSLIEVDMIGAMVEPDPDFVDMVEQASASHGIRLRLNLSPADVSAALSTATLALLPFPDGVSNKRGSALACLDHGLSVLTTHSEKTPAWLSAVTHGVATSEEAAALLGRIVAGDVARTRSPEILFRELQARDWHQIAHEHLTLYAAALRR